MESFKDGRTAILRNVLNYSPSDMASNSSRLQPSAVLTSLHNWPLQNKGMPLLRSSNQLLSGFGGLVVSILASGTRVRGFEPGRSCSIFRLSE